MPNAAGGGASIQPDGRNGSYCSVASDLAGAALHFLLDAGTSKHGTGGFAGCDRRPDRFDRSRLERPDNGAPILEKVARQEAVLSTNVLRNPSANEEAGDQFYPAACRSRPCRFVTSFSSRSASW